MPHILGLRWTMRLRARAAWMALALAVNVGCRTPATRPAGCRANSLSRRATLVRQVAGDSVTTATAQPARTVYSCLTEPFAYWRSWGAGLIEKRLALKLMGAPEPICPNRPTLDPALLEADTRRLSKEAPSPADIRLFVDAEDARQALAGVIESANCRLDVFMYLWGDDTIGWEAARLLAAKASPSLPGRVLVDGGGNLYQGLPKGARPAELNRAVCW